MRQKMNKNLKTAGWMVGTPIILLLLFVVAIYLPPVQKWMVDLATGYLSRETEMEISVKRVRLKFPLDFSLGGVKMIASPDTVLDAEELLANIQILPLLKGDVNITNVTLTNVKINTLDLVESMWFKGHVGKLQTNDIVWGLIDGKMAVPVLSLEHSDLAISLADSVPEDTSEVESNVLSQMNLQKVVLSDVAFNLNLAPSSDSMYVSTWFDKAIAACRLNLKEGSYYVAPLRIQNSDINYDVGCEIPSRGFDMFHINLKAVDLDVDTLSYLSTGDLYVSVRQLKARDRGGLQIDSLQGVYRMNSETLYVENTHIITPVSALSIDYRMDLDAFDTIPSAGTFALNAEGTLGKADILQFAADMADQVERSLPDSPLRLCLMAEGNMHSLNIRHLGAHMKDAFDVTGTIAMTNLTEDNIGLDTQMKISGQNLSWLKGFLPQETASAINIPVGIYLDGDVKMEGNRLKADAVLTFGNSRAWMKADYNKNGDAYDIDLEMDDFNIDNLVPVGAPCHATGHLKVKGKGFDFDSSRTYANAVLDLQHLDYGTYYLDHTNMVGSIENHLIQANMEFNDERLDGQFDVAGTINGKGIDVNMILDLPFSDLQALGFSVDPLTAHATHGEIKANSNFKELFFVDAVIEGVEVVLRGDSLTTDKFDLQAETTKDSTSIELKTSDMDLDFHSPNNLFTLIQEYTKVAEIAQQQLQDRALDISVLKQMMPQATLKANIGNQNPISKFLFMQGFRYKEVAANLRTSKEYGLQGGAHVYGFVTNDSVRVDTVRFDLYQDTTQIIYNLAVSCPDQKVCSAFTAYLDGYVSPRNVDCRLTYFNKQKEMGIDLGVFGEITPDSMLHLSLYPEEPIIAFRPFSVNKDNYINLYKKNKTYANVLLQSKTDNSMISVLANPVDSQLQNIEVVARNINLEELMQVIPFAPQLGGLLEVNANYVMTDSGFTVDGLVSADQFSYEGTGMGDLMTMFNYQPMGEEGHDINGMIYRNDVHIGAIKGNYNVVAPDYLNASLVLDQLPLSMSNAFIPDNIFAFDGVIDGMITVEGSTDSLLFSGVLTPDDVHITSDIYSFNLTLANEPIQFTRSHIDFNEIKIFGAGQNPLTINGYVDFSDLKEIAMNLSLYGQNFLVLNAPRTRKSALFGKFYGDFFARVNGTTNDLKVRGLVSVLNSTDITYIMTNTPLSVDYRLDDIVTFVDFSAPPDASKREPRTFTGLDLQLNLEVEDGVQLRCEFSADKQSYVNVQGNGRITMEYTPEGVFSMRGRYTVNEGEMKYALPVIPLKTFALKKGSYIEFTGKPDNPTMNISATEQTKASVSNSDGSSRSVLFNVGMKISNTLENMGLEFTIDAPEDIAVQNELAGLTAEEKNKLAVALLATGMYLSGSNEKGFSTTNALNNFLQNEINNIAGKAVSTAVNVDMSVGMEQTRRDDGTTRTDYSFKFTKRFFSDRLNVVVGGRINADGNNNQNESGAYIDDISLEWRLDNGGTQYIRLFHDKNYDNLVEGELTENGAGIVLRKKLDQLSDLFIWKKKKNEKNK